MFELPGNKPPIHQNIYDEKRDRNVINATTETFRIIIQSKCFITIHEFKGMIEWNVKMRNINVFVLGIILFFSLGILPTTAIIF